MMTFVALWTGSLWGKPVWGVWWAWDARLVTTALYQLERTGGRYALATMCIGVGQGIALVIERL